MIFVGLGSNLPSHYGGPVDTIRQALRLLQAGGDQVVRQSRWYESAPVPVSDQPWYVNAVVEVASARDSTSLLSRLHQIEELIGRIRSAPNAARPIDLDLLDYHGQRCDTWPILPHPRMAGRAFVLQPLADLVPDWCHPVTGRTIPELLSEVESVQTTRLLHIVGP